MEVSGQLHATAALPPGKEPPVSHSIEGWVAPSADLDVVTRRIPIIAQGQVLSPVIHISLYLVRWVKYIARMREQTFVENIS
jgi:hypothetical protein